MKIVPITFKVDYPVFFSLADKKDWVFGLPGSGIPSHSPHMVANYTLPKVHWDNAWVNLYDWWAGMVPHRVDAKLLKPAYRPMETVQLTWNLVYREFNPGDKVTHVQGTGFEGEVYTVTSFTAPKHVKDRASVTVQELGYSISTSLLMPADSTFSLPWQPDLV